MIATQSSDGDGKLVVILTPRHVATFIDWLEGIGGTVTAQVIRDTRKRHGHAGAVIAVQQAMQQISAAIVAEDEP